MRNNVDFHCRRCSSQDVVLRKVVIELGVSVYQKLVIWVTYTLQPHYNTVVYSMNSLTTRLRLGSHFLCIFPSL